MKTDLKYKLGARIKELRTSHKWSQDTLSEKVGVDPKYISRIEVGASYPSPEVLDKIARSLGVSVMGLFDFDHLSPKAIDAKKIEALLKGVDEQKMRMVYKLVKAILQ